MGVTDSEKSTMMIDELNALERNKHIGGIIFVSILMTMGVFGNSHVLLAYSIKVKQTPRTIFILMLGMLDLMASCFGMPFVIFLLTNLLTFDFQIACKVLRFNSYFMSAASALTLLVVAIDRYRKICLPMSRQITKSTAKLLCLGVVVVSCMIIWPSVILYGSDDTTISQSNITGTSCVILEEYRDTVYLTVFYSILLTMSVIVGICFIVLYCLIGKVIADFRKPVIALSHTKGSEKIYTLQKHTGVGNLQERRKSSNVAIISGSNTCQTSSTNVSRVSSELKPIEATSHCEQGQGTAKQQRDGTGTLMENVYFGEQTVKGDEITQENCAHIYNKGNVNENSNEQIKEGTSVGEIMKIDRNITYTHTLKRDDDKVEIDIGCITNNRIIEFDVIENMDSENAGGITNTLNETNSIKEIESGLDNTTTIQPVRRKYTKAHRTTFMLCLITFVFILSYASLLILRVLAVGVTGFMESMSDEELFIHNTFVWTYYINNVANPVIYWFFDEEFRQKVKDFYRRVCCSFRNNY